MQLIYIFLSVSRQIHCLRFFDGLLQNRLVRLGLKPDHRLRESLSRLVDIFLPCRRVCEHPLCRMGRLFKGIPSRAEIVLFFVGGSRVRQCRKRCLVSLLDQSFCRVEKCLICFQNICLLRVLILNDFLGIHKSL